MRGKLILAFGEWSGQIDLWKKIEMFRRKALDWTNGRMSKCIETFKINKKYALSLIL